MEFEFEHNYEAGHDRFVHYATDQKIDAEVDLTVDDSAQTYTIDSTKTDPALRGQGIAGQLMQAVVGRAHETGYHIINVCPYAVNYFDKHHDEYADVLQ